MPIHSFEEVERMSVLPEARKWTRTSVTLPSQQLERLEKLREEINEERDKPDRLGRDDFFALLLEWAEKELREERKKGGGGSKKG